MKQTLFIDDGKEVGQAVAVLLTQIGYQIGNAA